MSWETSCHKLGGIESVDALTECFTLHHQISTQALDPSCREQNDAPMRTSKALVSWFRMDVNRPDNTLVLQKSQTFTTSQVASIPFALVGQTWRSAVAHFVWATGVTTSLPVANRAWIIRFPNVWKAQDGVKHNKRRSSYFPQVLLACVSSPRLLAVFAP